MIEAFGRERMHEPHTKHLRGPFWEMRMRRSAGALSCRYGTKSPHRPRVRQADPNDAGVKSILP
jgi:hypothetical protein